VTFLTWNVSTGRYNSPFVDDYGNSPSSKQGSRVIGFGKLTNNVTTQDEVVSQTADGTVYIGYTILTGATITDTNAFQSRNQSTDWIGQGVADLDGNGRDDIVWRNAATGAISYWSYTGGDPRQLNIRQINTTPVTLEWDLVGMGDLDADGDDDLIWRRNTDGFTVAWLMAGGGISSVAGIAAPDWSWRFEGTGDMNGDGRTDLIWRNEAGQYAAYMMNGATVTSVSTSATIGFDQLTMGRNQAFFRSL
jgi:hypothetical protein